MRDAHPLEQKIGIKYYLSDSEGTGGKLRDSPADFVVREIESITPEPLDADPSVYQHLVVRVTLTDWETNEFVSVLSDRVGISRERISWAGTKDKRAVSTQLFTIDRLDHTELPDIERSSIEPVGRFGRRLFFGDLAGNDFTITVRDPDQPDRASTITDELLQVAPDSGTIGVPNYFGQQRFGSIRPITHRVGLRIIKRDWKEAVMTYVATPSDEEPADTRETRQFVRETEDWVEGLDRMPSRLRHERAILHSLAAATDETDDPYRTALEVLPQNLQRLFVHGAQSYLFNQIVSERLSRSLPLTEAIEGDVVCFTDTIDGLIVPEATRVEAVTSDRIETVNRLVSRGRAFVTAPLAGTDSELAGGEQGTIEAEILDDHDIDLSDFDLPGVFGSSGTRRPMIVTPEISITQKPLRFKFSLPRGAYATVVLREYLKTSPLALR